MSRGWVLIGAFSGFLAVAMGAFGAHALAERLEPRALAVFQTGAQYQMYHALALVALGAWASGHPEVSTAIPGWSFAAGTLLFSGSLYALALTDMKLLGAITPFGGLAFLAGWISLAWIAWKRI